MANLKMYGSICLSDIPRECIKFVEKNGKKYLTISIVKLNEPSRYGDTHFISCAPKQEERVEGVNYIIGNLREYVPKAVTPEDIQNAPAADALDDDLPF